MLFVAKYKVVVIVPPTKWPDSPECAAIARRIETRPQWRHIIRAVQYLMSAEFDVRVRRIAPEAVNGLGLFPSKTELEQATLYAQ